MKFNRIIAFSFAAATLLAAVWAYADYVYLLGFPDGATTELERAERILAYVFIGISLVCGAFNLFFGLAAARMNARAKLAAVIIFYLLCAICLFALDSRFQATLMNGAGG